MERQFAAAKPAFARLIRNEADAVLSAHQRRPEIRDHVDLPLVAELLVPEHQQMVLLIQGLQRLDRVGRNRLSQVQVDFRPERMESLPWQGRSHLRFPLCGSWWAE